MEYGIFIACRIEEYTWLGDYDLAQKHLLQCNRNYTYIQLDYACISLGFRSEAWVCVLYLGVSAKKCTHKPTCSHILSEGSGHMSIPEYSTCLASFPAFISQPCEIKAGVGRTRLQDKSWGGKDWERGYYMLT